jgi:hypothetical protein
MQKTGKTTRGENDIDVIVQKVVGEMLGVSAASAQKSQPARTAPASSSPLPNGELLADGMNVFSKGRELSKNEVRSLMMNTDALRLYDKGLSRRKSGTAMFWSGIGVAALGIVGLVVGEPAYYDSGYDYDDDILYTLGPPCILAGGALIVTGITFRILGRFPVKKAVESYNSQYFSSSSSTPELQFGFTKHGVGLVYRF